METAVTEANKKAGELERSIADGAGTIQNIREIIQQVRRQPIGGDSGEGQDDNGTGDEK